MLEKDFRLLIREGILLVLLIIVLLSSSCASYKAKKLIAKDHISQLSKGILLIRIDGRDRKIQLLQQAGNHEEAQKLKEKIQDRNQRLITAFKNHYFFSDFCFYPNTKREVIKYHDYSSVYDYDYNLCDFDEDIPIYFMFFESELSLFRTPSFVIYEIKDNKIMRLEKPFPYKFRTSTFFIYENNLEVGVKNMDRILENYLYKNTK